jgi:hypothetical protein
VMAPPCLHRSHHMPEAVGLSLRYSDTFACVSCIESLRRGRLSLRPDRLSDEASPRFVDFWSRVAIKGLDHCWNWAGPVRSNGRPQYSWRRRWQGRGHQAKWGPQRVAFWLSWGDIGLLPITTTCGNPHCCNPLHLRARFVPHHPWHSRLDVIDLLGTAVQRGAGELPVDATDFPHLATRPRPDHGSRHERTLQALSDD